VATLDWHNQGASPRPLPDPLKVHVTDFSEYDEVLATLLEKFVAPISQKPPLVLAHSMGGHILLRTLHEKPSVFCAAIITSPMQAIDMRGLPSWVVSGIALIMNFGGRANDWVLGVNSRDPLTDPFEGNPVTSDKARWDASHDFLRVHPAMRVVGPTWSWLLAAWRSMAAMMNPNYARAITTPTLIFGAGIDRICLTPAARAFAANLPHGKYVELAEARHEILMENDSIRTAFWKEFDAFVAQSA
jgi:lysophospholipase